MREKGLRGRDAVKEYKRVREGSSKSIRMEIKVCQHGLF